jgi:hypothetical protein
VSFALGPMSKQRLTDEQIRYNLESRTLDEIRKDLFNTWNEIDLLRREKLWNRILTASVIAEWGLILMLADKLLSR